MTSGYEITTIALAALALVGSVFAYVIHASSKYSTDITIALRDSAKALKTTEEHALQLALTKDHAETALALGEKHTQALSENGARVAAMESTFQDIRAKLNQLDGIRDDIGELKVSVATLTEQGQNTRNDVQELSKIVTVLNRSRRSTKKRQRK